MSDRRRQVDMGELLLEVREEQKEHRAILMQIREQAIKTNGRVSTLEQKRSDLEPVLWDTKKRVENLENKNSIEAATHKSVWRAREFAAKYGIQLLTFFLSLIAIWRTSA